LGNYLFDAHLWFEILPELAIAIYVDGGSFGPVDLPAAQRLAGIEAGGRRQFLDGRLNCTSALGCSIH
jgi:hypothetical protein